jgi:Phage tail lysozyme
VAYEGPEYWYVIYKAIADFGDLMRDAAAAKAELAAMADAAKVETAAEVAGATQAAAARAKDIQVIKEETTALTQLGTAAKNTNQQLLYGGRTDEAQHLSDLAAELRYRDLLNRATWLGFSTVQQAVAYRQQMLQLALLENRARFGGYQTPDQYLGYLQREIAAYNAEGVAIRQRGLAISEETTQLLAYQNAVAGTHQSLGQLGEGYSALASYQDALTATPLQVTTRADFDDAAAQAALATWRAELGDLPRTVVTTQLAIEAPAPRLALPPGGTGEPDITEEWANAMRVLQGLATLRAAWQRMQETEPVALPGAGGAGGGGPPRPPPAAGAAPSEPNPEDAAAWDALTEAEARAGDQAKLTADDFLQMAAGASSGAKAYAYVRAAALAAALANQDAGDKSRGAGAAIAAMVPGIVAAAGGFFGWNAQLRLFGGLFGAGLLGTVGGLHVLLDGIIEVLAILIPSIVTLVAGLAAFVLVGNLAQDTLGRISDRLKATYTAATATGQSIYPVTNAFDSLAKVIRPEIWQLYGDALTVASGKVGLIGELATRTGAVLDRMAARFAVWAQNASKGLDSFFRVGGQDLAKLGQLLLVLGNALLNLIRVTQDTHVDQIFLGFIIVLAKLLDLITKLPTPLLAAIVGLHAFWLWGGLAATIVLQMLNPLRALALALGGVAAVDVAGDASGFTRLKAGLTDVVNGFAALPGRITAYAEKLGILVPAEDAVAVGAGEAAVGAEAATAATFSWAGAMGVLTAVLPPLLILAAAVAVGVFAVKVITAKDSTQRWIDTLNQGLGSASFMAVIGKTVGDLAEATQELTDKQNLNAQAVHELTGVQSQLTGQLQTELVHTGEISKAYGVDMPMALQLLQTAGVKASDLFTTQASVWAADEQQVRGLVAGYAAMGQGLTQLQGDVSVQLVMNADQLASMQKLNQAWDQWITLVTSGESSFVTFQQNLASTNTNAVAAGASMGGLNAASLTLRSSYLQLLPQAGQVLDSIRSQSAVLQNGAAGTALLTKATRDLAIEMVPLAQGNQSARDSLLALVQEADPSVNTWQKLTKWVGPGGAAGAAASLDNIMTQLETPLSDLAADAQKLTTALQSDLTPAMAQAEFNALGGQAAFNAFATDLTKFGPGSSATIAAGRTVAEMLISINKNSAAAKDQFVSWAESMGLGIKQADQLWAEVSKGVTPLESVRKGLAASGTAAGNLASSGLWGTLRDGFAEAARNGSLFEVGILALFPVVRNVLGAVNRDVVAFFTKGIPAAALAVGSFFSGPFVTFFTNTVGGAIATGWAHAWSGLVSPVVHAFDAVKHAIAAGFDPWWAVHGRFITQTWDAMWNDVETGAVGAGRQIAQWAKVFWDFLSTNFKVAGSNLAAIWIGIWHILYQVGQAFWQLFGPLIKSGWDIAVGVWRIAQGTVTALAKQFWDGLLAFGKGFWASLTALVKLAWDTIVAIFSVALDLITGHWSQAWTDIKTYGEQVWNILKAFFSSEWQIFGTLFSQTLSNMKGSWENTWNAIRTAAGQVWSALKSGFEDVVASIQRTWDTLEGIFRGPVSFLVNTVYDGGIARLWNDVMGAIGGPKLPVLKFGSGGYLAQDGGRLGGYGGGDVVPALLEPGEAVVDKDRTQKYSWLLRLMGVPGFQGGGIIGDITGFLSGATHEVVNLLGDAFDVGKIVMALGTGNTTALANALTKFVGPGSSVAELAEMITGIPKTMITALVNEAKHAATKAFSAVGLPGGSATAGVETVARYVMAQGGTKEAGAGVGGVVAGESGGSPEAIQSGGGGGTGLIQWTPGSSAFPIQPLITGNVGRDMAAQLVDMMAYIASRGGLGRINAGGASGGPMGAAEVFSAMEAPAVPGSDIRPSVVAQLYAQGLAAGGPVVFPSGQNAAQTWNKYSKQVLPAAVAAEQAAFWRLSGARLPGGPRITEKDRAQWYADMLILDAQQKRTIGMGTIPAGAYMTLQEYFGSPGQISPRLWQNFSANLDLLTSWQGGSGVGGGATPPASTWHYEDVGGQWPRPLPKGWKPGHIEPSGYAGWKWLHGDWSTLRTRLLGLQSAESIAQQAWGELYGSGNRGPGGGGGAPAPIGTGLQYNLEPYAAVGGPAHPVYDVATGTGGGYGFSGGGLAGLAGRFAFGGPVIRPPVAGRLSGRLSTGSPESEAPRALSAAGAASRGALNVDTLNIYNPRAEEPSQSIIRASNRLAFMRGRGLA